MGAADARRADIARRRDAGESLESIARAHGVTRERIRQILKRAELGAPGYARHRREQRAELDGHRAAGVNRWRH